MGRILITYATRSGSTADVANILAGGLRDQGHDVVVADARENPSAVGYELVLAGSGINAGLWFAEATNWLQRNAAVLEGRTALFNVCLGAVDPAKRNETLAYNDLAARIVEPLNQNSFAGRYVPAQVGFLKRLFLRSLRTQPQDHVDPDAIRAWADELSGLVPAA
ncbi:flavodoxin domain-containing protein [Tessaracoccus sp. OS52]|uniref:flavodoxin domain-containing protein n=1 Tax=Tessaracoccus sp. OS52 TaxID=2886691 RepID=UPI001D1125B5|nr:flavodoxin domain-containing protein [Tessaracoccus sp. OS52]MCC2593696.1 flavodoxin domain-containing protein [Tessaracoccus sp. OS52]